jgi:alkanesulfonate monooxygenase SsuD/methylene tetrahydromethanopterin reductase-like flavin-dependent oxidoreductase (luciferase family)
MMQALALYRSRFEPSEQLARPYAMLGVNVIAADTDQEAAWLFTSLQQSFVNLRRGRPGQLPPPVDDVSLFAAPAEQAQLRQALSCSFVGAPRTVAAGLQAFVNETRPDELIVSGHIYDHAARMRSFALAAEVRDQLTKSA